MKKIFAVLLAAAMLIPCIAYAVPGIAKYYLIAISGNTTAINSVVTDLVGMDYSTKYSYLPSVATISNGMQNSNIWIIHGHGNAGFVQCMQSENEFEILDTSTISEFDSDALSSTSYALYISCYSAKISSDKKSLVSATRQKGAKAVTGFYNGVSQGEEWAECLFENLLEGYTLSKSLSNADTRFRQIYGNISDSPAISSNRLTSGDTNVVLKR